MQKFSSKAFFFNITKLALPLMAQNFLHAFLLFTNIFMVSQISLTSLVGFSLSWTLIFGAIIVFFGIASGSTFFIKRCLAKQDFYGLKIFTVISLITNLTIATIFASLFYLQAKQILILISGNEKIANTGLVFFKLASLSLPIIAFNTTITNYLSIVSHRKLITKILSSNIVLTIICNYIVLFRLNLGIEGLAWVMITIRSLESIIMLILFLSPHNPFMREKTIKSNYNNEDISELLSMFLKIVLPIVFLEIGWVASGLVFKIIFAYMGLREIAAYTIVESFTTIYATIFVAIATVASVVIGNEIQHKNPKQAEFYSKTFIRLNFVIVVPMGILLGIFSPFIAKLYNLPEDTHRFLYQSLILLSVMLSFKAYNYLMMLGIHRAGGDTRFTVIIGFIGMIIIALPLGYYMAFILDKPYFAVFAITFIEENIRNLLCLWRYYKRNWLQFNLQSYE